MRRSGDSLAGRLLLASPSLDDPNFGDAVVLLCHHDAEGSMGLVVNRPLEIEVGTVLGDLGIDPPGPAAGDSTYEGGPVDPFRGFVLHDGWNLFDSTLQVTPELHLTTSRDVLEAIGRGEGPEHFLLLLGYAGWEAGQLEEEIVRNDWLLAPASQQIVFHVPPDRRWAAGARNAGITRSTLSSQIGHA